MSLSTDELKHRVNELAETLKTEGWSDKVWDKKHDYIKELEHRGNVSEEEMKKYWNNSSIYYIPKMT